MAINFPDSPSTNDTHTVGDKTWTWNGTYWHLNQNSSTYYAQDGVPSDPDGGDFWFESDTGQLFVRYDSTWVEIGHATDFGSSMSDADGDTLIQLEEGSDEDIIRFDTGGTERMTIAADGAVNVGGTLTAGAFSGPLTGNVTGNASGTALTVTQAAQTAITSVGTLTGLTISGDLTVDGTTTTINSTTLTVDDKNIELGSVATPSDTTADGGGITLKGASDWTILWTNSTNAWHFNQGINVTAGNVGIGTTTPAAPLSFANATGQKIDFYYTTGSGGDRYGIQVQSSELRIHSGALGTSTGGITFGKQTTSAFTENMRITNDGNVGIGTTTPSSTLHVAGNIRTDNALIVEGTNAAAIRLTQTDTDGAYISITETDGSTRMGYMGFPSNDDLHLKNETSGGHVYLSTNNATRMTIASDGRVAIGTAVEGQVPNLTLGGTGANEGGQLNFKGGTSYGTEMYLDRYGDNLRMIYGGTSVLEFEPDGDIRMRSGNNLHQSIYRVGGIFFTWDSDSYGTNTNHSIRSTDGDTWGDNITINSYGNVRVNIDSNNNGTNTFSIGHSTTGTGNTVFTVAESGLLTTAGGIDGPQDFIVGNGEGEQILFQGTSNQTFLMSNGTWRAYVNSSGHFLPYANAAYDLGASSLGWKQVYTSGWYRTVGAGGWYSQTYGGGWHMSDSTWIRSYGSRSIYHNSGIMRTDGTLQIGDGGVHLYANHYGMTLGKNSSPGANTKLALVGGGLGIHSTTFTNDASIHVSTSYGGYSRWTQMGGGSSCLNIMYGGNWFAWGCKDSTHFKINYGTSFGVAGLEVTNTNSTVARISDNSTPCLYATTESTSYVGTMLWSWADRAANSGFALFRGTTSNNADAEFNLRGDGNGYCDGSWSGNGADYAEYFEWEDGNPANEDRRGVAVTLVGDKVRAATADDTVIGVVSTNPVVVGDAQWDSWRNKYLHDDYGSYILEDVELVSWSETKPLLTEDGDPVLVEDDPQSETIDHSYHVASLPDGVTPPDDAEYVMSAERVLNPDWDEDLKEAYVSREDRPEWVTIGLVGKLRVRKGQPTGTSWIKMRDVSDAVEEWLVR